MGIESLIENFLGIFYGSLTHLIHFIVKNLQISLKNIPKYLEKHVKTELRFVKL